MDEVIKTILPTIQASDGNRIIFRIEHLQKFFGEEIYENILKLSPEERDIWFKFQKESQDILLHVLRPEAITHVMGPGYSLESAAQEDSDETAEDELLILYKEWLTNQN